MIKTGIRLKPAKYSGKIRGVRGMRIKKSAIMYVIVAAVIAVSGICFGGVRAGSDLMRTDGWESFFSSAPSCQVVAEVHGCTSDMLGLHTRVVRVDSESVHFEKAISFFLYFTKFYPYGNRFCSEQETAQYVNNISCKVITDYIHDRDGKKRF